jgi:hypothetical protein
MLANYKKTGRDGASRATRKAFRFDDGIASRERVAAAVGRAALWGLLPLRLADKLIRWARRST